VGVFREVRRVLKANGTCWLNIGDSYNAYNGGAGPGSRLSKTQTEQRPQLETGFGLQCKTLKPKDLIGIPWRVAFALQTDGWWLRSDIIWAKPNPMPESVRDRCTRSHEYVFLLTKGAKYWYDADAVREPFSTDPKENYPERARITGRGNQGAAAARGNDRGKSGGFPPASHKGSTFNRGKTAIHELGRASDVPREDSPLGRNKRSVWTLATLPTPEAHFATFPLELPELCLLAGCPEGGTVLDPFAGAGTTGLACLKNGRKFLGVELNPEYVEIAHERARKYYPLFADARAVCPACAETEA